LIGERRNPAYEDAETVNHTFYPSREFVPWHVSDAVNGCAFFS